ncbi:DUF2478 domain-containing protein [Alisedimentitalea sp. MJ-SS2]|uniref:DUF2478 domain-containing protein n=1 Tax=Aliisedimentitalea sp. MJ-SS2 TaxID=3049795 RepID=UPI002913F93F|nr:DUF2478 domain-containing protein [Alisedimentitalea sp. MJ-SS2]MDU8928194.1 DUF2478 domain-containing protein [Alisedimentitalea sp. MJ-SS2]
MKIASVNSAERGETDRLLTTVAQQLGDRGHALAGIVKVLEHESTFDNGCDMKVRVLPAGPDIQITQNLGVGSDACRLDPSAIADAVAQVESGALEGAELFILNKFGPEEASGRGFCAVIGAAIEQGIPVLVGVGAGGKAAFDDFTGGLAQSVNPDESAILDWFKD